MKLDTLTYTINTQITQHIKKYNSQTRKATSHTHYPTCLLFHFFTPLLIYVFQFQLLYFSYLRSRLFAHLLSYTCSYSHPYVRTSALCLILIMPSMLTGSDQQQNSEKKFSQTKSIHQQTPIEHAQEILHHVPLPPSVYPTASAALSILLNTTQTQKHGNTPPTRRKSQSSKSTLTPIQEISQEQSPKPVPQDTSELNAITDIPVTGE